MKWGILRECCSKSINAAKLRKLIKKVENGQTKAPINSYSMTCWNSVEKKKYLPRNPGHESNA